MVDKIHMTLDLSRFNARMSRFIQASEQEADQAVLDTAVDVKADTQENWPVDSGESRAAWWGPRRIAPATYQIGNPTPQAPVIEYGAFRGLGPKTVQAGGESLPGGININPGIYSSQVPSAPLRRALASNYTKMGQRIKAALRKSWGR